MITLPKEWLDYNNTIRDRCRDLIEFKIWSGIDLNSFEAWRQNFKTDEEKYFSACVLDSLIYRSNTQTYSLINQLLFKNLNNLFRILGEAALQNFPECLRQTTTDPLVRFIPAICSDDPVTKSSNEILRFMKRHFQISEKWIINPWNIESEVINGVKAFVFIDDFLGTGHQFSNVISDSSLQDRITKSLLVYAPLIAHKKGISYLTGLHPNLKIIYAEKLDEKLHSFFINYFPTEVAKAKAFYINLLNSRGIIFGSGNEYGYGNLELTFAFEHAAPDNSLQILHKKTDSWFPLFNR